MAKDDPEWVRRSRVSVAELLERYGDGPRPAESDAPFGDEYAANEATPKLCRNCAKWSARDSRKAALLATCTLTGKRTAHHDTCDEWEAG